MKVYRIDYDYTENDQIIRSIENVLALDISYAYEAAKEMQIGLGWEIVSITFITDICRDLTKK